MPSANFTSGVEYLVEGFKSLNQKPFRLLVWLPFCLSIILLILLGYTAVHFLGHFVEWLLHFLPNWLLWLQWLVWIIGIILVLLIFSFSFSFIVNLLAAPFYGALAERVAKLHRPEDQATVPQPSVMRTVGYSLKLQLQLLGYYLPRALGCLILSFIPIIQTAATPAWFALNAWLLAWQYLGYTMENHLIPFKEMKKQLRQERILTLSFGSIIAVIMFIPIVNLLLIPSAVIGGTRLWLDHYQK